MKINTGRGSISLFTLLAVWSVSAVTSLPGLAISPILGDLTKIFPHVSQFKLDMLTSLPSLLIIPVMLISGKIADKGGKIKLVIIGLSIFLLSSILYFFAESITLLILIGCLLGIGAGIVIPLSTSLIATIFDGKYRVSQLGVSSSITNVTLVIATFVSGILADVNWHLPFIVYSLPVVSLILILRAQKSDELSGAVALGESSGDSFAGVDDEPSIKGIKPKNIARLIGIYFMITYLVLTIVFELSVMFDAEGHDSSISGTMISVLFLAIMTPGLFLNRIIHLLKANTNLIATLLIVAGLFIIYITHSIYLVSVGCIISGFGYGIMQPVIYEKATDVSTKKTTTLILGLVMSMNYFAILLFPVILQALQALLRMSSSRDTFLINSVIGILFLILLYFYRHTFSVGMERSYYDDEVKK